MDTSTEPARGFVHACDFSEGLAAAGVLQSDGPKWDYIDTTGAWVMQPRFEFSGGIARVVSQADAYSGNPSYIDKADLLVWEAR